MILARKSSGSGDYALSPDPTPASVTGEASRGLSLESRGGHGSRRHFKRRPALSKPHQLQVSHSLPTHLLHATNECVRNQTTVLYYQRPYIGAMYRLWCCQRYGLWFMYCRSEVRRGSRILIQGEARHETGNWKLEM